MEAPSEAIALKQTVVNNYNDVQYVEVPFGTDETITVAELNPEKTWAIAHPSDACVTQVQALVPGSEVRQFSVPFLLSPKALRYFVMNPVHTEAAVVSYQTAHWDEEVPIKTVYILFKRKGKTVFDHFVIRRNKAVQPQKEALIDQIQQVLGINVQSNWFFPKGRWVTVRGYNPVIDYYSTIRTKVYTLSIRQSKIKHLLNYLDVFPTLSDSNIKDTVALQVRKEKSPLSQIMLFTKQDFNHEKLRKFMHPICHNVLCRLYNKPVLQQSQAVQLFDVKPYPMYERIQEEKKE